MCVARPLVPSEGVSWLGDGLAFDLLLLLLVCGYLLWAAARGGLTRPLGAVDGCVAALVALCADQRLLRRLGYQPAFCDRHAVGMGRHGPRLFPHSPVGAFRVRSTRTGRGDVWRCRGDQRVWLLPGPRELAGRSGRLCGRSGTGHARSARTSFFQRVAGSRRLEDRLQSTEPLATFALANSLAGFLLPWLVVALGTIWASAESRFVRGQTSEQQERVSWSKIARSTVFIAAMLAVAGCLLLTKSRSAYVALGVSALLLPLCGSRWRRINRKFVAASGAAIVLLVGGAIAVGSLDAEVLTEASKSLQFRFQYWRATLAMIANYPWLGVGPGNFQDYYTQYILPQASEEVRDPHNFLFEVWATCGTFALVALAAVLITFAWRMGQGTVPAREAVAASPAANVESSVLLLVGGFAGFVLAFLIGPFSGYAFTELQIVLWLAIEAIVVAALWSWIVAGRLPPIALALGVLALAIHWLAAGGVAFPGVAGSFWILMALCINGMEAEPSAGGRSRQQTRYPLLLLALVLICGAAACYFTAYRPVTRLRAAMAAAAQVSHPQAKIVAYLEAAQADPLSAEPWLMIAELEMEKLRQDRGTPASYQNFLDSSDKVLDLRPHSSSTWRQIGGWFVEVYKRGRFEKAGDVAIDRLRRAVELYPTSAVVRADLALALDMMGKRDIARRQAAQAISLDEQMPHADRKLPLEMRASLEALAAESR